jgi:hypothetical protein
MCTGEILLAEEDEKLNSSAVGLPKADGTIILFCSITCAMQSPEWLLGLERERMEELEILGEAYVEAARKGH